MPSSNPSASRGRSRRFAGSMLVVAMTSAGIAAWLLWPMQPRIVVDPGDAQQVETGAAAYRTHCASCHGADLEGQPEWRTRRPDGRLPAPPHDETGHTWHHPDEHLFALVKHGLQPPLAPEGYESDMPAFDGILSDEEILAVLAYIKSRWPPEIRRRQSEISAR